MSIHDHERSFGEWADSQSLVGLGDYPGVSLGESTIDLRTGEIERGFFEDPSAVARLRAEAASWIGTPYYKFSCVKGRDGGVDCAGLLKPLYVAAGLAAHYLAAGFDFLFARSDADYQSHRTELRILQLLRGEVASDPQSIALSELFAEIALPKDKAALSNLAPERFMPGDLLVLRSGGQFHLPVMLNGTRFIHCFRPYGVLEGDIHDPTYSKPLDAHFRPRALTSIASYGGASDAGIAGAVSALPHVTGHTSQIT
jgi:hypothetical protein